MARTTSSGTSSEGKPVNARLYRPRCRGSVALVCMDACATQLWAGFPVAPEGFYAVLGQLARWFYPFGSGAHCNNYYYNSGVQNERSTWPDPIRRELMLLPRCGTTYQPTITSREAPKGRTRTGAAVRHGGAVVLHVAQTCRGSRRGLGAAQSAP
jgi:hypothetical protein